MCKSTLNGAKKQSKNKFYDMSNNQNHLMCKTINLIYVSDFDKGDHLFQK